MLDHTSVSTVPEEPATKINSAEEYPMPRGPGELLMEIGRLEAQLRALQAEYESSLVCYKEKMDRFWDNYNRASASRAACRNQSR